MAPDDHEEEGEEGLDVANPLGSDLPSALAGAAGPPNPHTLTPNT